MARKDWGRMLRGGAGLEVEYMEKVPKLERLARSFSAFSNSSGGHIFLGVSDDGEVLGLEHVKGSEELVKEVAQFHCDPTVDITIEYWEKFPGAELLVVHVPEAENKPVYAVNPSNPKDAWPFFRSDKENLPIEKKSIKAMRKKPAAVPDDEIENLDRHTVTILNQLAAHPRSTINQLANSANLSSHRAKKILFQLEQKGWIHAYFNENRREYSLAVRWRKK